MAITSIVSLVIFSLVMFTSSGARSLYRATDTYESVRMPATMISQDARSALAWESCISTFAYSNLKLTFDSYTIEYLLRSQGAGLSTLVRIRWEGGQKVEETTLATDLASPPSGSTFGCRNDIGGENRIEYRLVKPRLPNQTRGIEEYGRIYVRNG